MIAELEQLEIKQKVKLNVPLIITYLKLGYTRNQIAKVCNLHHSAVYDYCERHWNDIAPMLDKSGIYHATVAEFVAIKSKEKLIGVLTNSDYDYDKKDIIPLTASSDRHTTQARLLQEKSTAKVSVDQAEGNIDTAVVDIIDIQAQIDKLKAS